MSRPVLSGDPINDSLELLTTPAGVSDMLAICRQYDDEADSVCGVAWVQDILLSRGLYITVDSLKGVRPDCPVKVVALLKSLEISSFTSVRSASRLPFSSWFSAISMIVFSRLERLSTFFRICFMIVSPTRFEIRRAEELLVQDYATTCGEENYFNYIFIGF